MCDCCACRASRVVRKSDSLKFPYTCTCTAADFESIFARYECSFLISRYEDCFVHNLMRLLFRLSDLTFAMQLRPLLSLLPPELHFRSFFSSAVPSLCAALLSSSPALPAPDLPIVCVCSCMYLQAHITSMSVRNMCTCTLAVVCTCVCWRVVCSRTHVHACVHRMCWFCTRELVLYLFLSLSYVPFSLSPGPSCSLLQPLLFKLLIEPLSFHCSCLSHTGPPHDVCLEAFSDVKQKEQGGNQGRE